MSVLVGLEGIVVDKALFSTVQLNTDICVLNRVGQRGVPLEVSNRTVSDVEVIQFVFIVRTVSD